MESNRLAPDFTYISRECLWKLTSVFPGQKQLWLQIQVNACPMAFFALHTARPGPIPHQGLFREVSMDGKIGWILSARFIPGDRIISLCVTPLRVGFSASDVLLVGNG